MNSPKPTSPEALRELILKDGRRRLGGRARVALAVAGLGLEAGEKIVGFLYVGSFEGERRNPPALQPLDFVSAWQG